MFYNKDSTRRLIMTLLEGKTLSRIEKDKIKEETQALSYQPGLTVVLVGDDPASQSYVRGKEKSAKEAGFKSEVIRLPEATSQEELLKLIERLNADASVHGILVQSPVPGHIDENVVINTIHPDKDVDCFHPRNFGLLFAGQPLVLPCTPMGIIRMLDHYQIPIEGKKAVVIGRSNIVGKPIAMLLLQRHATVTIAHSRTRDLAQLASQADILVAAIGKPLMIGPDMIKPGAVVIDVGINRIEDPGSEKGYRLVGDVDFDAVKDKCSAITPVPGGVGAMTIAMLLRNTLQMAALQQKS